METGDPIMQTRDQLTRREALLSCGMGATVSLLPGFAGIGFGDERTRHLVLNPYEKIDWPTVGQYKAALHVHTLQSDGYQAVREVVHAYRKAGYHIVSLTDHDWNWPNARVTWGELPPEAASPYPREPRPENFPANTTWPWTDYGCAAPDALGLVGIEGNELTFRHHINSYFSDYGVWYERTGNRAPYGGIVDAHGDEVWEDDQLLAIRDKRGLAIINHPGISNEHAWWERKPLEWYVARYDHHPPHYLVGIEVTNCEPRYRDYDEGLWDQLLARFMPGRPIWGFGTDDMHNLSNVPQSHTTFLLHAPTVAQVRQAMVAGQFCFCSSTQRINYLEESPDAADFPALKKVTVDQTQGTIALEADRCDEVRWISAPESLEPVEDYRTSDRPWPLGRPVHVGRVLDYQRTPGIGNYVRAELHRRDGEHTHRTFTNPFGFAGGGKPWLGMLTLVFLAALARTSTAEQPDSWVDRDHFPEAYSILTSDRVMFPDNVADWPLKIDSTRQLFVDDYVIGEIEHLTREFHQPVKHPGNPLMPGGYMAVLYEVKQAQFRMWNNLEVFTSTDGVKWIQQSPGPDDHLRTDGGQLRGLIYNPDLPDEEGRYKAVVQRRYNAQQQEPGGFYLYHSRDGINWERRPERAILDQTINVMRPGEFRPMGVGTPAEFRWDGTDHFQLNGVGDTSTFRYDTILKRYIFDGKVGLYFTPEKIQQLGLEMDHKPRLRLRTFSESDDLIHWSPPRFLLYPDRLDPPDRQMYGHVGFVYESMWIGVLQAMRVRATGWKQTDLQLTYSRDGRQWLRPREREPFIPLGDADDWDADYSVSCYTAPVRVNDELFFYYGGSRNPERDRDPEGRWPLYVGLAKLRRDGFASLNAGETPGRVMTRPLARAGDSLFVNADVGEEGWIKAAVLSRDAEPIGQYTLEDAAPLNQDTTRGRMVWKSNEEIDLPDHEHLRIVFQLKNARLYSFWIE
jgi:hypothetical protein